MRTFSSAEMGWLLGARRPTRSAAAGEAPLARPHRWPRRRADLRDAVAPLVAGCTRAPAGRGPPTARTTRRPSPLLTSPRCPGGAAARRGRRGVRRPGLTHDRPMDVVMVGAGEDGPCGSGGDPLRGRGRRRAIGGVDRRAGVALRADRLGAGWLPRALDRHRGRRRGRGGRARRALPRRVAGASASVRCATTRPSTRGVERARSRRATGREAHRGRRR